MHVRVSTAQFFHSVDSLCEAIGSVYDLGDMDVAY